MPTLTGNQLWCVRQALGESQSQFAKRMFLYQVRIYRMEALRESNLKTRDANDILRIASENGIEVPAPEDANARRDAVKEEVA